MATDELQSYITSIQQIKSESANLFDSTVAAKYANALLDVDAKQAALLLSTQGLTNAQIAETLAMTESNSAKNYETMLNAGLLKSKISLTNAELQSAIAAQTNSEFKAQEIMQSMGLQIAMEGEEAQTVQLTAAKLKEAVMSGKLTEAQAQEIAMRAGCTVAMNTQSGTAMPTWVANMKAMTAATWLQVKATAAWLATNPVPWIVAAGAAFAGLAYVIQSNIKTLEDWKNELDDAKSSISEYEGEITELESELSSVKDKINELGENPVNIVDQNTLSALKEQRSELEQQLQIVQALNEEAKDIAENATIQILENTSRIVGAVETLESLKKFDIWGAVTSSDAYLGGIVNAVDKFNKKDYSGALESITVAIATYGGSPIAALYNWLYPQKKLGKINDKIAEQSTALSGNIKTLQEYKCN